MQIFIAKLQLGSWYPSNIEVLITLVFKIIVICISRRQYRQNIIITYVSTNIT